MEYQGLTLQQWTDAIAGYTVDSVITKLVPRIASGQFAFSGVPSYATLVMQNKPMLDIFEDELAEFKVDEQARIDAIFVELNARKALQDRIDAIPVDFIEVARLAGNNETNMELLKKRILDEKDEALLASLEAQVPAAQVDRAKNSGINQALQAIEGGKRIVAYMNALNAAKNPTALQVKAVLQDADLSLIKALLESGSLATAKVEIEAYTPSGIITQADKDAILAELNSLLGL